MNNPTTTKYPTASPNELTTSMVRQAHHERNQQAHNERNQQARHERNQQAQDERKQQVTVRPELVEGLNQTCRVGNAILPTTIMHRSGNRWAKKPAHPTCMSNSKAMPHSYPSHQSGAVLIVSLIMLLLLTLIGVTGSQVTSLEEKMAGNSKDHNLAFQAAESALRAGETATATITANGYYTGSTHPIDWTNAKVTTYSGVTLYGVSQAPKYIIEAPTTTVGGGGDGGCPPCEVGIADGGGGSSSWYRITARGTGGTANAVVTLQSIYKR